MRMRYPLRNLCLFAGLFLCILPGMFPNQEPPLSQDSQDAPFKISVCTEIVALSATVRDGKGRLVSNLAQEDFQVYEDGIPQHIEYFSREDVPVTVGLILDNSGTMRPKRPEVVAAALVFARSSNPEDQMFVVHFNEKVSFSLPPDMPFTDKVDQLEMALSGIAPNGMTAIYDAVAAGLEHLKKGNRDKKVLIVISDGDDNASKQGLEHVLAMAGRSDAIIYTIGIFDENNPDRNPQRLRKFANVSGGDAFLPASAKDVISICKQIAYDIRNQYSIAYQPTNKKADGTYRTIRVTAHARDGRRLFVHTRAGYYAPLSEPPHENPN